MKKLCLSFFVLGFLAMTTLAQVITPIPDFDKDPLKKPLPEVTKSSTPGLAESKDFNQVIEYIKVMRPEVLENRSQPKRAWVLSPTFDYEYHYQAENGVRYTRTITTWSGVVLAGDDWIVAAAVAEPQVIATPKMRSGMAKWKIWDVAYDGKRWGTRNWHTNGFTATLAWGQVKKIGPYKASGLHQQMLNDSDLKKFAKMFG